MHHSLVYKKIQKRIQPYALPGTLPDEQNSMQCTSYYRDPLEQAAWQLYLRENGLRVAREEMAFLEATGGATIEEVARIRGRVVSGDYCAMMPAVKEEEAIPAIVLPNPPSGPTVSLKSILTDVVHADAAANQLCRRVRPLLEQQGIVTFKKHQAVHVLRADAERVRDICESLV